VSLQDDAGALGLFITNCFFWVILIVVIGIHVFSVLINLCYIILGGLVGVHLCGRGSIIFIFSILVWDNSEALAHLVACSLFLDIIIISVLLFYHLFDSGVFWFFFLGNLDYLFTFLIFENLIFIFFLEATRALL